MAGRPRGGGHGLWPRHLRHPRRCRWVFDFRQPGARIARSQTAHGRIRDRLQGGQGDDCDGDEMEALKRMISPGAWPAGRGRARRSRETGASSRPRRMARSWRSRRARSRGRSGRGGRAGGADVERHSSEPLVEIVKRCHQSLLPTRGVALSLARWEARDRVLTWIGVGNVDGLLLNGQGGKAP